MFGFLKKLMPVSHTFTEAQEETMDDLYEEIEDLIANELTLDLEAEGLVDASEEVREERLDEQKDEASDMFTDKWREWFSTEKDKEDAKAFIKYLKNVVKTLEEG